MTMDGDMHEASQQQAMQALLREALDRAGGWLPFPRFMQEALYAPGLGYYSAGAQKFGSGGDFVTAPELSPLFGACIARQLAPVLGALGGGDVLELGAGSGCLAADLLTGLAGLGQLPQRYCILEVSADLRERQRQRLAALPAELSARVAWLEAPPEAPWQGALVANEVLDALPVEVFAVRAGGFAQRGVVAGDDGALAWGERPAPPALAAELARLQADLPQPMAEGHVSEVCLLAGPWIDTVTRSLQRGLALFIDYGLPRAEYYHPLRAAGTLRCHYRHRAHDNPFYRPGLQDLTAWVDFTRVAEAADAAGLDVLGYTTQAAFLLGNGIEALVTRQVEALARARSASEARRLLMPDEMGEAFKVIALGRGLDQPLAGFSLSDLRSRL
jgi:SAM-dependent MidA family methyltransferase